MPEAVRLPAQSAKKVPAIDVDVWLVTDHWKLLHEDGFGMAIAWEVHVPAKGPVATGEAPALGPLATPAGASIFLACSKLQAVARAATARSAARKDRRCFTSSPWCRPLVFAC